MSNEQKVCCGGFFIGDGLEMDGKTLKALGGGGEGVTYVECHTDDFSTFECELSPEQVFALIENGENVKVKLVINSQPSMYIVLDLFAYSLTPFSDPLSANFHTTAVSALGASTMIAGYTVQFNNSGTITGSMTNKML